MSSPSNVIWARRYLDLACEHERLLASGTLSYRERRRHCEGLDKVLEVARVYSYEAWAPEAKRLRGNTYDCVTVNADAPMGLLKAMRALFDLVESPGVRNALRVGLKKVLADALAVSPTMVNLVTLERVLRRYMREQGAGEELVGRLEGVLTRWADTHA